MDESTFRTVPTEEEQRETSPHRGHADDLANANGADGVIPDELNDGRGQPGHVTPGGPRPVYRSWWVPVALVALMWAAAMVVFGSVIFGGEEYRVTVYEWIVSGDFRVEITFFVDALTAVLLLVVSTVGLLVHVYSIGYMDGDRGVWRFFAYLNLFMFSMLLLILADNFLLLYVGWEAVGLCSYLLIGYWYKKPSAAGAAKKAFIVNRVGDFGFGLGVILIWTLLGSLAFEDVFAGIGGLEEWQVTLIALLLFAGAVGKSRPVPAPRLAARRDGGPDPGQRPHPRRDHGQRRGLPGRPLEPDLRRGPDGHGGRRRHRGVHRGPGRGHRPDPERHQEGPRLLHRQPAGVHVLWRWGSGRGCRPSSICWPTASSRACCSWRRAR